MRAAGAVSKCRRAARVLEISSPLIQSSCRFEQSATYNSSQSIQLRRFYSIFSGLSHGKPDQMQLRYEKNYMQLTLPSLARQNILFSSDASLMENDKSDELSVMAMYENMVKCVSEKRTAPPNSWLWSLVAKCSTHEDIKLLFDILKRLRTFRLSNLRIPDNFNSALCREVTKACVRVGAIDFGKKALWKHNLYGLTPDIGSAHHLLLHAKQHNDVELMVEVIKLLKKNKLPFQPGTSDIVFSICYGTNRWDLISKYGKRFVRSGVSLRQTSFDLWMEFASRKGDTNYLWKIEEWRSESMKQHSLSTGFSCVKGFLLDHKPESAAAVIQIMNQTLPETKRPYIEVEVQKLVAQWPLDVIQHQKEENRKVFAEALRKDISSMINVLPSLGVKVNVLVEDFTEKDGVLS